MNPSTLGYDAACARIRDLQESAENARRRTPITTKLAAAAVRPASERRGAVRGVLAALLSR
jgi:hypothetical protein